MIKTNTIFSDMDPGSKLWIFMSEEPFTDETMYLIRSDLKIHMDSWHAHGQSLTADSSIEYNQFILIAVDEKQVIASGCSIDSTFRFIMDLEKKYNLSLLNRNLLAYLENDQVKLISRSEFKGAVNEGRISEDTFVFNNTIDRTHMLGDWLVEAKNSWFYDAFFK